MLTHMNSWPGLFYNVSKKCACICLYQVHWGVTWYCLIKNTLETFFAWVCWGTGTDQCHFHSFQWGKMTWGASVLSYKFWTKNTLIWILRQKSGNISKTLNCATCWKYTTRLPHGQVQVFEIPRVFICRKVLHLTWWYHHSGLADIDRISDKHTRDCSPHPGCRQG